MLFCFAAPLCAYVFTIRNFAVLGLASFQGNCGALYQGLRVWDYLACLYPPICMLRKLTMATVFVLLKDNQFFQCQVMLISCIGTMIYITTCRPFILSFHNWMECGNELFLMFFAYFGLIFSDFTAGYTIKYVCGKIAIVAVGVCVAVNVGCAGYAGVKAVKHAYKKRQLKRNKCKRIKKNITRDLNVTQVGLCTSPDVI